MTSPDIALVATLLPASYVGASRRTGGGSWKATQRAASSGSAEKAAWRRSSQLLRAARPRCIAAWKNALASSGTSNGGSSHPSASRVLATSSAPSGDPWAEAVSCLLGLPYPMWVLHEISDGRPDSALAAPIASSTAVRSWPSTVSVCHPYASNRLGTSSEKVHSVGPSSEIRLSS